MNGWIGVDLDGTLAVYDGWKGIEHVGEPIPAMLERVKAWLVEGKEVRIMTARVCRMFDPTSSPGYLEGVRAHEVIQEWCEKHVGQGLMVTCVKDFGMVELWDDRAKQVLPNQGIAIEELVDWAALKADPPAGEPA